MRKKKIRDIINPGTKDKLIDISLPGKIWAKRIDSDTDSHFWIAFSTVKISTGEITKFIKEQIRRAERERPRIVDDTSPEYHSNRVNEVNRINIVDSALKQILDELTVLEGKPGVLEAWLTSNAKNAKPLSSLSSLFPKLLDPPLISLKKRRDSNRRYNISKGKKGKPHKRRRKCLPKAGYDFLRREWNDMSIGNYSNKEKELELEKRYRGIKEPAWPDYKASTLVRYAKCSNYQSFLRVAHRKKKP